MDSLVVSDELTHVSVVLVSYNSLPCFKTLKATLLALPHVIIVDNGSQDATADFVREHLPNVQLLALPENLGYGRANNAALLQIDTPYALLLNPDCEITPQQVADLVHTARNEYPHAHALAPQLLSSQGKPQVNYSWPRHWYPPHAPNTQPATGDLCVGYACAAVLLLNLQALRTLDELQFFDPRFFLYYEDEDLCLRIWKQRSSGERGQIIVTSKVRVYHASRGSVQTKTLAARWRSEYWRAFHHVQSKVAFTAKHWQLTHSASASYGAWLRALQLKTWGAVVLLALLVFLPIPKIWARALGRLQGLRSLPKQP